jgi:UDP:flavonoid glycosyltransferase YjiC (YdhE family)
LAEFLIVTWQAGGGVNPALGLARLLVARGHELRVLAPRLLEAEVETAGCVWRPFPQEAEFDPAAGRAAGEQRDYLEETFFGTILPEALRAEVRSKPPAALVVDALLASTVSAAQALEPPVAALVHTLRSFHGDYEIFGTWGRARIDELRNRLGQDPLENEKSLFVELQRRCELELVALPAEFDGRPALDENVVHMGWITEEPAAATGSEFPWDRTDPRPLVVVGLSSTYMHQEGLMERILAALSDLPVRVLASTRPELDPSELRAPENIEVRRWVPHSLVLPEAALMVTHAGVGSLMAAFAYGVPCVCIPLGRDQPRNAARAVELGAAIALPRDAQVDAIRAAVVQSLDSQDLRANAGRLQRAIAEYRNGSRGVTALEELAG